MLYLVAQQFPAKRNIQFQNAPKNIICTICKICVSHFPPSGGARGGSTVPGEAYKFVESSSATFASLAPQEAQRTTLCTAIF